MSVMTLKPGLLVSLSARKAGGIEYARVNLENKTEDEGTKVEKWETTKTVVDPAEEERATKVRGKCRSIISSVCTKSAFGLLCPADKEMALDEAIKQSRALCDTFNASASVTQISVFVLKGRIAESDQEAASAIADEIKGLLSEMRNGIATADVKAIRDAASRAKQMGRMLDEMTAKKITAAVEEARFVAKEITRRLDDPDEAESVAAYVAEIKLASLSESRFAFLDMDPMEAATPIEMETRSVELQGDEDDGPPDVDTRAEELDADAVKAAEGYTGPALEV
jgi:hypothetical protein